MTSEVRAGLRSIFDYACNLLVYICNPSADDELMETKNIALPSISDSEWEVMEIVWAQNPLSSYEIIEQLHNKDWSPKTIKTLIHRLEKKGVLSHSQEKREYLYFPVIEKSSYVSKRSDSFINKVFGGATAPMVAHFIKNKKMSADELNEIKKLIDEMGEN